MTYTKGQINQFAREQLVARTSTSILTDADSITKFAPVKLVKDYVDQKIPSITYLKKTSLNFAPGIMTLDCSKYFQAEIAGVTDDIILQLDNAEDYNYIFTIETTAPGAGVTVQNGTIVSGTVPPEEAKFHVICMKNGDTINVYIEDAGNYVFSGGPTGGGDETPLTLTALTFGDRTGMNEGPLPDYVAVGGGAPWEHFGLSPKYLAAANEGGITWQFKTGKVSALSFRRENLSTHYAGSSGAYSNNHAMAFPFSDTHPYVINNAGDLVNLTPATWSNNQWGVLAKVPKVGGGYELKFFIATDPALKSTWGTALYNFGTVNFDMYIQAHLVNDGDTLNSPKGWGLS